jgi:hypothetical protein
MIMAMLRLFLAGIEGTDGGDEKEIGMEVRYCTSGCARIGVNLPKGGIR